MRRRARVFFAALATAAGLVTTHAAPSRARGAAVVAAPSPSRVRLSGVPCVGCVASFAPGPDPAPLLLVLHGDSGHGPAELLERWDKWVAPKGAAVLALACPADRGCKGSFWRWNGAPAWITQQVDGLATRRQIDKKRMWLVGWSGGASYMGYRTQELEKTFAALVLHGGGIPPADGVCGQDKRPVFFVVGDGNPLHHLARSLRDHYAACGHEVRWSLLPRADHAGEWRGLDAHGQAIATWLAGKRVD
jgi:predicted esterase